MQDTANAAEATSKAAETATQNAPEAAAIQLPEWMPSPLIDAWNWLDAYPWAAFLTIIVLAFLVGKLVQVFFDRVVSRLTAKTETELDDDLVAILHRPIFLTVFFLGMALALRVLDLPEKLVYFLSHLLQTMLVLVWLVSGFRIFRLLLEALSRNRERFSMLEERTIPLFDMIGKLVLVGGASYALLMIWGIDPTAWLASAGVLGLAFGFAAKDTLANLFGGLFIVADAPYKLGDFVVLDTGERGRVTHVGIRSTRLLTRDDIEVTVPNAIMANAKIINETGGPSEKERIRVPVGVAYGSDVDQVCSVLEKVAIAQDHICQHPEPRVRFRTFGASSLDFELLCWIDEPVLRGKLIHELNMAIYKAFQAEGIEIPFPQQDVHVKSLPDGKSTPARPSE